MGITIYDENNIADSLHEAYEEGYEEGYRQARIDEAKEWENKVEELRMEYESLKRDMQLYYMVKM